MANPSKMFWTAPTAYVDGSTFGAEDFAGFTLYIDGKPGVSVPRQWDTDLHYEMDLAEMPGLVAIGTHKVAMTVVARNGKESGKTPEITYEIADERTPLSPFGLSVE